MIDETEQSINDCLAKEHKPIHSTFLPVITDWETKTAIPDVQTLPHLVNDTNIQILIGW